MALLPTTPPGSSIDCTSCTATRSLSVSFTAPSPAPTNGYIVKWKKASESIYTVYPGPNPTSSPVVITNVPACEDIDVIVQSSCGGGQLSTEVTTVATGLGFGLKCDCGYQGSTSEMAYYQYPNIPLDFGTSQNGSTITIGYNVVGRINRFSVYNVTDATVTTTSGWAGTANYSGPWGASNNTPSTGTLQFTYNSAKVYQLRVEAGGADPSNQLSDSWNVSMGCVYTPPAPTYYYYTGILCGGSTQQSFRSTTSNLDSANLIVKAMCSACGNTVQCFDNISVTSTPNTNDVISTHVDCPTCSGASSGTASFTITNMTSNTVSLTDFSPAWFTIDTGTPSSLTAGNSASGTHGGYNGSWSVTVGSSNNACLVLRRNEGEIVASVAITGAGIYNFPSMVIASTDEVVLEITSSCP